MSPINEAKTQSYYWKRYKLKVLGIIPDETTTAVAASLYSWIWLLYELSHCKNMQK